jgi:hypothetical protein
MNGRKEGREVKKGGGSKEGRRRGGGETVSSVPLLTLRPCGGAWER